MLKAAYNYQVSAKDPGAFAHNAKYIIELLYDSIDDLNGKISKPVDMTKLARDDAGHFAGDTEPFRHWDSTGEVPAGCAKCHSADGLPAVHPQCRHRGRDQVRSARSPAWSPSRLPMASCARPAMTRPTGRTATPLRAFRSPPAFP